MDEIIKIIDLQQRKQYKKNQQNKWGSYKNMFPNSTHIIFKILHIRSHAKPRIGYKRETGKYSYIYIYIFKISSRTDYFIICRGTKV